MAHGFALLHNRHNIVGDVNYHTSSSLPVVSFNRRRRRPRWIVALLVALSRAALEPISSAPALLRAARSSPAETRKTTQQCRVCACARERARARGACVCVRKTGHKYCAVPPASFARCVPRKPHPGRCGTGPCAPGWRTRASPTRTACSSTPSGTRPTPGYVLS